MVTILVLELLCTAAVVFMLRFLVALRGDAKTKTACSVVRLTPRNPHPKDEPSRATLAKAAPLQRDANFPAYRVIAGGRERPFRNVG